MAARSARSPSSNAPHFSAQRWPELRLSNTTGLSPAAATSLAVWLPMKPAPPTMRIVDK